MYFYYKLYDFTFHSIIIFITILLKQGKSEGFHSCDRPSNLTEIGFKSSFFQPMWPWNLMDDLQNNSTPLLCYFKLCAAFHSHWWIQTRVTVRKRLTWVKIDDFFSRATLKFYDNSPKHYQAICIISSSYMNSNWSYSQETPNLCQIRQFLEPCDLEIWQMTLKNNRAPLLWYFRHGAAFCSHWSIQTGVTVRKRPIWVKFYDF